MKLAVIGAGPKGAAIAAKAHALGTAGYQRPDITIFDPDGPGAAWTGTNGYTDGLQPLCTLAERDLGFPYDRVTFGKTVASDMLSRFSWHSFSVADGADDTLYRNWVVQGRRPPAHRDFATYIASGIRNSGATLQQSRVTSLDYDHQSSQWLVSYVDQNRTLADAFDGVVVTGSGPPLPSLRNANARVFDGHRFWQNLAQILLLLRNDPAPTVAIIGAGGTAAAIAHWFVREGIADVPVTVIGREATLFIRRSTPFEERLFTDEAAWSALAPHVREAFVARLTRGVVWDYVLDRLGDAMNIQYRSADVREFNVSSSPAPAGLPPAITAVLDDPPDPRAPTPSSQAPPAGFLSAAVFVDARGFNAWHFATLLPVNLQSHFANRATVMAAVDYSLCVGPPFPSGLHVPMLASVQGPAAANLMGLGWMSDRILRRYISPAQIVHHLAQ